MENLFMQLQNQGGKIVLTSELTEVQIREARAYNRLWVNEKNIGFVFIPSKD
jgi:hypothetical protein